MWIQKRQRDNRHDLNNKIASGEILRTECRSIVYMTFVDLTKAFDTVMFGCPPRFITMVRQFNDDMQAHVQNDGEFSEPFEVMNGVKQGCVIAPTLFSHAHGCFSGQ